MGVAPTSPEACRSFVLALIQCQATALCFGVGDVHSRVPSALRESCVEHDLPLLEAPLGAPFEAVTEYLAHRQVAEEAARHIREHDLLTELLAAVRARADTPALLKLVHSALPGHVDMHRPDGAETASADPRQLTSALGDGQALVWDEAPSPSGQRLLDQIARVVAVATHEHDVEVIYRWERIGQLILLVGDGLASPTALRPLFAEASLGHDVVVASAWPPGAALLLAEHLPRSLIGQTREATIALTGSEGPAVSTAQDLSLLCGYGSPLPLGETGRSITEARAALQPAQRKGRRLAPRY